MGQPRKDDAQVEQYVMVGRAGVPLYVRDLKKEIAYAQPTWGQLVRDSQWINRLQKGEQAADRSVCALLADAAAAANIGLEYRVPDLLGTLGECFFFFFFVDFFFQNHRG
jgi:hypothetical protein